MTRPRVLVISYLPPACGGIATWTSILRDSTPEARCLLSFEALSTDSDRPSSIPSKGMEALRLAGRLIRHIRRSRPDVVHLNCCLSPLGLWRDLAVGLVASAARVPLVVHYRGSVPDVDARLPGLSRLALLALTRLARINLALTRDSELFLRRKRASVESLPNFIEDEWLGRPRDNGRGFGEKRPRAVYVGRLSRDKGTEELLQTARLLPHVDFVLLGEVMAEVRVSVEAAPPNVSVVHERSRMQVRDWLLRSDLLVFPSHREGFPYAVLEGMAAGLPVVSTRVGAIPEMIDDFEGGFLVDSGDVRAMAAAVGRLADSPTLSRRMGDHNRQVCRERFTFSAVFARLLQVYETLARADRGERAPDLHLPEGEIVR